MFARHIVRCKVNTVLVSHLCRLKCKDSLELAADAVWQLGEVQRNKDKEYGEERQRRDGEGTDNYRRETDSHAVEQFSRQK